MSAVIIGATGGIGRALTLGLSESGYGGTIRALSRSGEGDWPEGVTPGRIDILDEASISDAAAAAGAPDLVIVASGILSKGERLQPEKSWRHQSLEAYEEIFRINTFGPGLVAKHFLPCMPREDRTVFCSAVGPCRFDQRQWPGGMACLSRLKGCAEHADPEFRHRAGSEE